MASASGLFAPSPPPVALGHPFAACGRTLSGMDRIPESVWLHRIAGLHLHGASLDAELAGPPRLLVFLRHFG